MANLTAGVADSHSARLVVAFVPTKFRVYHGLLKFPPDSELLNWDLNDLPDKLRLALANVSPRIGYIDLTPSLVRAARVGRLVYFADDTHFNEEGNRVAAEALHSVLRN